MSEERPSTSSYKPTPLTEEEIEARLSRAYQKAVEKQRASAGSWNELKHRLLQDPAVAQAYEEHLEWFMARHAKDFQALADR